MMIKPGKCNLYLQIVDQGTWEANLEIISWRRFCVTDREMRNLYYIFFNQVCPMTLSSFIAFIFLDKKSGLWGKPFFSLPLLFS